MTLLNMMRGGGHSHSLVPSGKQHYSILALLAFAVLFLCVFALPATAQAVDYSEVKQGSLTFHVYDDHAEVWGYDGTEADLVIPSSVSGKPVTKIARPFGYSFDNEEVHGDKLKSVHVPGSIEDLAGFDNIRWVGAFCSCHNLEAVTIDPGVKAIGPSSFRDCSSLRSVSLPDGLEEISTRAFYGCPFESISIPNTVSSMGLACFMDCDKLTSLAFPKGLKRLPGFACKGDTSLRNVVIPQGVTMIGSPEYNGTGNQEGYAFSGCTSLSNVIIPSSVTYISENSFYECSFLKSVELLSTKLNEVSTAWLRGAFQNLAKGSVIYVQNDVVYNAINKDTVITPSLTTVVNRNAKPAPTPNSTPAKKTEMYRLYNPNSGEHFYTSNAGERDHLKSVGWTDEGKGWNAPAKSNTPVYRLYNPNAGEHHYAMSKNERDELVRLGWTDEGVGWYSDDARGVKLYRLYNPNAYANNHHYTLSANEHDTLVAMGWRDEGAAWYGCKG